MHTDREEFLAGERPTDVHIFLHEEAVSNLDSLASHGERLADGLVLVLDGEQARDVFRRTTGIDPMGFAQDAMGTDGTVAADCTSGQCPDADQSDSSETDGDGDSADSHRARFVFAFAEEQNEDVDGIYADGDVIHAYVACSCGTRYSDKWLVSERSVEE